MSSEDEQNLFNCDMNESKYLRFFKDNSFEGWGFESSDERLPGSHHELMTAEQINGQLSRDGFFLLIFQHIASDPQLIECSNGLHEAFAVGRAFSGWRLLPCFFNRNMYFKFSHFVRYRRRDETPISLDEIEWMNLVQLGLAKILCEELFKVSVPAIDQLIENLSN